MSRSDPTQKTKLPTIQNLFVEGPHQVQCPVLDTAKLDTSKAVWAQKINPTTVKRAIGGEIMQQNFRGKLETHPQVAKAGDAIFVNGAHDTYIPTYEGERVQFDELDKLESIGYEIVSKEGDAVFIKSPPARFLVGIVDARIAIKAKPDGPDNDPNNFRFLSPGASLKISASGKISGLDQEGFNKWKLTPPPSQTNADFDSAAKHRFSNDDRALIKTTLQSYLDIDPADCDALITDIEMTGSFRHFGYGSLIGDPASETDAQYGGAVDGWEKGAFCKDRAFRGKSNDLGVTMGAIEVSDSAPLKGVVNEIHEQGSDDFVDRVIRNIKDFALRETGLNPIYKYRVVDVNTDKKGTVKALICAADHENPLYLGPDKEQLSLEQKAVIIATSIGDKDADGKFISNPRHTGMAYWRDHIYCCHLGGFDPDPKIKRLVELAEYYREQLKTADPQAYSWLNSIERKQRPANARPGVTYANPVYDGSKVRPPFNPLNVKALRQTAKSAASLRQDPLSRDDVDSIKDRIVQLNHQLG